MSVKRFLLLFIVAFVQQLQAQRSISDSTVSTFMFHAAYSLQFPSGDLTQYFGVNSTIGGGIMYKSDKNWINGIAGSYLFGDQVKNRAELLSMISTSEGEVIDGDGLNTSLALFERGFHLRYTTGKLFPAFGPNPNSGFIVMASIGYLAHHIRIETQFGSAPQLQGDYAKGYDKLRGGLALGAEAGYMIMSNSRILNFSAAFEVVHARTKSLRDYDFSIRAKDNNRYSDTYFGIRLNWYIPTYQRSPQKFYYY
jgi:hypothetical protein